MLDETPKRFDRIVAILIQLQSKKIVKAQELADRFECSLRTIYRDIRTLEASGVPIYSEAGVGYALMDGYRLPPVMFTREEVSSFIAAEKLMQKFTDPSLGNTLCLGDVQTEIGFKKQRQRLSFEHRIENRNAGCRTDV